MGFYGLLWAFMGFFQIIHDFQWIKGSHGNILKLNDLFSDAAHQRDRDGESSAIARFVAEPS